MRSKQLCSHFSLPQKLKLFYNRVTLSKITAFYFLFSLVHAIVQTSLQARAFSANARAGDFLWSILQQSNATVNGFTVLRDDLWLCEDPPASFSVQTCTMIWSGGAMDDLKEAITSPNSPSITLTSSSSSASGGTFQGGPSSTVLPVLLPTSTVTTTIIVLPNPSSSFSFTQPRPTLVPSYDDNDFEEIEDEDTPEDLYERLSDLFESDTGSNVHEGHYASDKLFYKRSMSEVVHTLSVVGGTQVKIQGFGFNDYEVVLDQTCLTALNWPLATLYYTKREDIVFVTFQLWVLTISVVALLNESIPHVLVSLLTHMLATAWSSFQIKRTSNFRAEFTRLTTQGACSPVNLLSKSAYWQPRGDAEIASLVLNILGLLVAAFFAWRLTKAFGWRTFKRIGSSLQVHRQYTVVLALSISIQLSCFFIVVAVTLFIDQLYNGSIARMAVNSIVYKVVLIVVLLLLLPWLTMGWISARRELRIPMLIFLAMSFLYLIGWGAMFFSTTFRWTFVQWCFFGTMTCASVFLTATTFICGIICRIGFGIGLLRYLTAQELLPGDDFIAVEPPEIEKVYFPSRDHPVPTFAATFCPEDETYSQNGQLVSGLHCVSSDRWNGSGASSHTSHSHTGSEISGVDLSEKVKKERRVRDRWVIE